MRDAFLKALEVDDNDITTRLVYADWLDEQGEHEEAERQRKWPAAKEWLLQSCAQTPDPDTGRISFTYEDLMAFGRQLVEGPGAAVYVVDNLSDIEHAILNKLEEFCQNWSVVTGVPPHLELEKKSFYWQCCDNEEYWIGGAPPPAAAADEPEAEIEEWDEWEHVQDDLSSSDAHGFKARRRKKRKP